MGYFTNLVIALLGRNPYREQLEAVQKEYDMTAEMVASLNERIFKLEDKLSKAEQELVNFQNLTENLRQSVTEKEAAKYNQWKNYVEEIRKAEEKHTAIVNELKQQYEEQIQQLKQQHEREVIDRHEEYEEKLNGLREDIARTSDRLQEANKAMANNLMAQSMLDKTNNGLNDLVSAMASGEVETVLAATQYLDWSSYLTRIAQCFLNVLRRKNELEERLSLAAGDEEDVNFES